MLEISVYRQRLGIIFGHHRSSIGVADKLIEVHYKVASVGGDEVSFRVDGEFWVVALIGEEG